MCKYINNNERKRDKIKDSVLETADKQQPTYINDGPDINYRNVFPHKKNWNMQ